MKKEKQVRTYQRKTKSGKVVVVRAHKAKYDAAEDLKKSITKKKGSGLEMESLKNEGVENPFGVEMDDFKEWYAFNDWDTPKKEWPVAVRRVDKALLSGMGKKSYDDFCAKVDESWTARGYRRAMKDLSALSKSPVARQSSSDAAKSRRAIDISDEVDANGSKSYSKEEGSAMLKRIQKAGFNRYMQSVFYDGYKFNDPETGDTLWMNVSTDKRGRMHFDTMHPLDRDEHYNYYEKEREAEKKRDAQRMRERNAKPQKLTLDEFLGLRGLSAPISNFMMDKLRLPHGLTQRGWKRLYKDADKANDEYHTKREAAIKEYKKLVKEGKIVPPTTMERLERNAKGHPDNASTQAAKRVLEKRAARMAKKLPKGSFITVDEDGNEIPGAPKHGTRSAIPSIESGKKSKPELSPREKEKQDEEKAMRVIRRNPYLKFTSDNKGVTLKKVTAATAKKMSLDNLIRYVAAETYCFRRGANPRGSLENAVLWGTKGRDAILEAFFKNK